ncbi:AAA+ ATPase domain and ATPase, AAA-type, core domain and P-loop containing nucleoside triphosphate hydrolase domain-containing protein [Strongyloides ratti]|uniref:AAA+ ATPase domain and ATPase, AAA-type, core domain and P-loop containing nucleoside triphosphate hydrolase domain-containing protein n=1 Tax=Strongyloides ratti TaxID=34506 RepID=A0A090L502_STRRB|nr:AAA+ ATPase domain and ATPase, AAA-type, core domain and P-loop containing nucleoside triphosphate hydrolase domain-containing protein [Strongyloides ratti]CEF63177.1 AAA+ ATPase domain and ATPase, AAA-type, core domain and P-loop containing nucleoside triphosphate hydrolase domain-containing protein [Strongyloides ratti]
MDIVKRIFRYTIKISLSLTISIFITKQIYQLIFPESNKTKKRQLIAKEILKALGINNPPELTDNESIILINFISTTNKITFNEIIGYKNIKTIIRRRIIYPLLLSCVNKTNNFLNPPMGVLFYGPPGNGKTKFSQALILESGCRFLNIDMSKIMNKLFGESQKLINALFSLAKKLEPVILFIDEIESFFRVRKATDNECMINFKAYFLSKWDEYIQNNSKIVIVGSSNMPKLIDPAILRRLSVKIFIDLPNEETRIDILKSLLPCVFTNPEIINDIKIKTRNLSCSDLIEICRNTVSDKINDKLESNFDYLNQKESGSFNYKETIKYNEFYFALNKFLNEKI